MGAELGLDEEDNVVMGIGDDTVTGGKHREISSQLRESVKNYTLQPSSGSQIRANAFTRWLNTSAVTTGFPMENI